MADVQAALRSAIAHIEHMAAWITARNTGYSFESLGEDMPDIKAALAQLDSADARERIARYLSEQFYVTQEQSDADWDSPSMLQWHRDAYSKAALVILSTGLLPDASPGRIPVEIISRYEHLLGAFEPINEPDPGTSNNHLRWMLQQLRGPMDAGKANRWLGFIQGIMAARGFITVPEERKFTRPFFASPGNGADDWRDDPSADERWNAGLDFGMLQFCAALGVDPKDVTWDAATETLDGDVNAAICNILRVKFGDDFDGTAPGNGAEKTEENSLIERGARAIAQSQGHDPDDLAPISEMCTADNQQVPWWKVFEEQAQAFANILPSSNPDAKTIHTLLDLLNPLHGELDRQTYDAKVAMDFDMPSDYGHEVIIPQQMESDLTQAVLILEDRKRNISTPVCAALHSTSAAGETTSSDGVPGKQSASGAAAAPIETEDAEVAFSPSELLFYGLTDAVGLSVAIHSIGGGKIKHEFDRSNIKQLIDALRPSEAIPADFETAFRGAMRELTSTSIAQYLLANTRARSDGAAKALHHTLLCQFYIAAIRNIDTDRVRRRYEQDYNALHEATAEALTSRLDEAIGFDLDGYVDDVVMDRFFASFHTIACNIIQARVKP